MPKETSHYVAPTKSKLYGLGTGARRITIPAYVINNKQFKFPIEDNDEIEFTIYKDCVVIRSAEK